jgi:hypothetical protein
MAGARIGRQEANVMGGVADWVRRALAELGPNAPDRDVKAYISKHAPTVPQGHISLALRKIRGKTIAAPNGEREGSSPKG